MFPELTRDDVFRLETRRLWLRWPRSADVPAIVKGAGDRAVADMTGIIPHPYGREHGEQFVLESRAANTEGTRLTLAITPRAKPNLLIGVVGIAWDREPEPFIGYWIAPDHQDDGIATEAARALIDAYFGYTEARVLTASARVINPASRRVLEKCGFAGVGSALKSFPARGGVLPVDLFRLDRKGWASFKAWSSTGFVPQARHDEVALCA